ncbi:class I SAM-dependent DNA methyltransferase [Bradyrhizobium manausense]|uniref:class I SAM-dependent DNA methyltransferase n=1 Tax=Bradyrhizobium manausense TaxID=989370 RepID=UPI001BAB7E00|nr:class I SAM-dependent DNA methyltransferase [Bradyrhizobium manausense]MBR0837831.1 class I SAM-dependent DNA methyltransferase [Bradyrhizobium manausense]
MNAVEIEEAISALAEQPFDAVEFPFAFLQAFGNKETTLKRLRKGETNRSDLGGVLQTGNIHIAIAAPGEVTAKLAALKASSTTSRAKAKFVLATDGVMFEAEDLISGETVACPYSEFPNHFGFFLPLAGITTVKQIRENAFDIRATGRLNRLYVELLKTNPEWGTSERRHDMNHFMARLIFCFFAESTDIFNGNDLFTATVTQMSDATNTHEVIGAVFRAMNTAIKDRPAADLPRWADAFPYVNGGLFSGSLDVPRFSRIARSYLLHIGSLDWRLINPDIFGSMIQAVAEDEERGALGMHYTSVPNILKVLNPLFLDDLRERLGEAGDNSRKLLNLRNRMARIRVFDPACGSGNFLVIAYKEMRAIEAEINRLRSEPEQRTVIPLTNFRGIELRDFPAEIARLALIIAEYQCDVVYRGQKEALRDFLPLDAENWITCGNAIRLDWLSICPPTGTGVKHHADDLFGTPLDQAQIDFENEGGETFICGNPPYQGSVNQKEEQKQDLEHVFRGIAKSYKDLDYVSAWFVRAAQYLSQIPGRAGLVATNSISQGEQVAMLWPYVFSQGLGITFAHTSFPWTNNAANNAGVTCVIVGIGRSGNKAIYTDEMKRRVASISPYLIEGPPTVVIKRSEPIGRLLPRMVTGNLPSDGGQLIMSYTEGLALVAKHPSAKPFLKRFVGSRELINGGDRWCLWIADDQVGAAIEIEEIARRLQGVRVAREGSRGDQAKGGISTPHRFVFAPHRSGYALAVPKVSSARREYIPCALTDDRTVVSDLARVIYDAPLWSFAIVASRVHLIWIATVCGKLKTDFRYSNTLGWNTFPVPTLTDKNKADLTRCAEDILLAREAHFPATIAELYDPEKMPPDLREAHERNDETLERIYIGRRFRNDTERLEKLFELYTKAVAKKTIDAA